MKETQDFTNKDHSILKKEFMDLSSPNQRYYICERVHVGSVPMFIFIHKKVALYMEIKRGQII